MTWSGLCRPAMADADDDLGDSSDGDVTPRVAERSSQATQPGMDISDQGHRHTANVLIKKKHRETRQVRMNVGVRRQG